MTERPARQISLRAFRGSISDIRQVVEVSRRDGQGNIQVLGFWTPYMQHPTDSSQSAHSPRVISTPEEVSAVVRADPVRAVPKPSQRKKR